jgi:methylenetetrahydrofolate dehydrogenase (NADP+)/methenyltetrahydrofolate cyclohydrolase
MAVKIIKDTALRDNIMGKVKSEINSLWQKHDKRPGIAFIGFLGVPLGKYNIPFHISMAESLGFRVFNEVQPDDITENDLFKKIDELNRNKEIHAIVLLQPLPQHLIPVRIMNRINPDKEVEGFHPQNMIKTLMPDISENSHPMCLPTALYELFKSNDIKAKKDDEWVLLLDEEFFSNQLVNMVTRTAFIKAVPDNCILTVVNRNSEKLADYCSRADFLVVVTKDPEYVKAEWLKQDVCIIDIYSNLVKEVPSKLNPSKSVPIVRGGVNLESVQDKAKAILPIPGGLMTIVLAILFNNAVAAFVNTLE